ncbi:hypothetical protein A8B79_02525 [Balneola sp. EhC07]|uniref:DUF4386 domain-containing protein n=1 Tax=Balneola sp. EhC07 TaxID=1849360 RepID=UPI0007F4BAFA|nr:DUF4386 domain-containing protein [Balneola sp. EhC07]OAN62446.1 hypothetical protein A8B79_02525 [Balneola sp. EhC07]
MTSSHQSLKKDARITGIWYLSLAVFGVLGFLVFHPKVFITGDPAATLQNIIENESIIRTRLLLELAIVLSQVLAAVWFYKLFRNINEWAAWSLAIWGTVNAVAIMISAIAMGSMINVASSSLVTDEQILLISVFHNVISNAWAVGSLFFGLWLIPMGYIVTHSRRMPVWLGYTLIIGGFGYMLSTFFNYSGIESSFTEYLTIPATVGEFWMIGYLLIFGIRPKE